MYAQMAADRGVQCPTSVEIDGELVCSIKELKKVLQRISVSFYLKSYVNIINFFKLSLINTIFFIG